MIDVKDAIPVGWEFDLPKDFDFKKFEKAWESGDSPLMASPDITMEWYEARWRDGSGKRKYIRIYFWMPDTADIYEEDLAVNRLWWQRTWKLTKPRLLLELPFKQ